MRRRIRLPQTFDRREYGRTQAVSEYHVHRRPFKRRHKTPAVVLWKFRFKSPYTVTFFYIFSYDLCILWVIQSANAWHKQLFSIRYIRAITPPFALDAQHKWCEECQKKMSYVLLSLKYQWNINFVDSSL